MGKFERIFAALEALPEDRREEIAAVLEDLFYGDVHPREYALSDEQIADLLESVRDTETEAFFA
ncbi:MAG TPA: hypothetical protein VG735_02335 [Caulobacterales bacterium]|nr:hypothetical protein [Caulobacterales bacterium]